MPPPTKKKCCRSTPRCGRCPVLAEAQARVRVQQAGRAALVEEILVGRPAPPLPPCVRTALLALG